VEFPNRETPHTVQDLRIPATLIEDLVLRRALLDGRTSTLRLAESLAVSVSLMERVLEDLRDLRLIEVASSEGRNLMLSLSDLGKTQANERMQLSRYVGPAPVSLHDYTNVVIGQAARPAIDKAGLEAAFSDLVIDDALLAELGPAIRSKGAIFLYGPPGTGKTSIAERLVRVDHDTVLVPHAVTVDGQIITVYDPGVHEPIDPQPERLDRRWMECKRPSIIAGGELTASALELTLEASTGIYLAPLQMQANNGVLVIDDFGRQLVTPEQLLNRWIVPLDRGIDYLSLAYGFKFTIPCIPKIVFSTNLEPQALGDEAFFRRIKSKVLIPPIGDAQFDEVLRIVSEHREVTVGPGAAEYLRWVSREKGDGDLRPYLPNSVCEIVESICDYEGTPRILDRAMVDRVASLYFTHNRAMKGDEDLNTLESGDLTISAF
jgi:predicted ATPase with chaperone activity